MTSHDRVSGTHTLEEELLLDVACLGQIDYRGGEREAVETPLDRPGLERSGERAKRSQLLER